MAFDPVVYDEWYEKHRELYQMELDMLRAFVSQYSRPGLEIGVGTGRFAAELEIEHGLDVSREMLEFAERRGIKTKLGVAEKLPYPDAYFGRVLVVTSFPFFNDPQRVVHEVRRVLKDDGGLIIGMVPRGGPFGKKYESAKNRGDARFRDAHFYTVAEMTSLISSLFVLAGFKSLIIDESGMHVVDEAVENAGFVAMAWEKRPEKF